MQPLERRFLTRLRRQAFDRLPTSGRILEVGAGTGMNLTYYPPGVAGVVTEPSREMIAIARQKSRPANVVLVQSWAEQLPFASRTFDAAVVTLVMCSVASAEQAFAELQRVVKPGGALVLLEHVRPGGLLGPLFDLLNLITWRLYGDRLNRRTAEMARAAGLKIKSQEKSLLGIINLIVCQV
jgi:ubiquinone/menaquinone biosynthesis C-methylase UbiE